MSASIIQNNFNAVFKKCQTWERCLTCTRQRGIISAYYILFENNMAYCVNSKLE